MLMSRYETHARHIPTWEIKLSKFVSKREDLSNGKSGSQLLYRFDERFE